MDKKDWTDSMMMTFNLIYDTTDHIESIKDSMERMESYVLALVILMYGICGLVVSFGAIYGFIFMVKRRRKNRTGRLKVNKKNESPPSTDAHFSFNKEIYP